MKKLNGYWILYTKVKISFWNIQFLTTYDLWGNEDKNVIIYIATLNIRLLLNNTEPYDQLLLCENQLFLTKAQYQIMYQKSVVIFEISELVPWWKMFILTGSVLCENLTDYKITLY
jgi:hypothetical protein